MLVISPLGNDVRVLNLFKGTDDLVVWDLSGGILKKIMTSVGVADTPE